MKILIVDDEKLARERLRDLIFEIDGKYTLSEADNGLTALNLLNDVQPDVILLDIRMPVMDGIETAYHLASLNPAPAVIFTTAYQDHAIEAFDANAVDYLLKPIRQERLHEALDRAQIINKARIDSLRDNNIGTKQRSHLSASNQGKLELIPIEDIRCLKAEQKYVTASWPGREVLIDESLKTLETEFPDKFLRIHRNALIALAHIEALEKDKDGKCYIHLNEISERLSISRRHLHDVRHVIKQLGKSG